MQSGWSLGRIIAQLPLRLGRASQDLRLSRTICPRSTRPPKQSRASGIREQGDSPASASGGLREKNHSITTRTNTAESNYDCASEGLRPLPPGASEAPLGRAVFLFWLTVRQYCTTQSQARANHLSSFRSSWIIVVEKNFVPVSGGCPSGFNKPFETKSGIS